ncbi:MAG: paraquat-inducible protein A [Flavobacteriales bacterium]|nr:paraquat-inducible protein A [Flavobacteriales bacterium]MDG1779794.1 paraquat-inducible protein A [Flavobacteriales bacterium]MDG2246846.1 paraquat-inducible protein A [Flavobacteriales bacterium]
MTRLFISVSLLVMISFCSLQVYKVESEKRVLKADYVELSHIKYGLFNVDEWKGIIADIIDKKVREFEITPENEKEIRKKTEKILKDLLDQAEVLMQEENKREGLKGFFRQAVSDIVVPFDKLRQRIPEFTNTIVKALKDPQTKKDLKNYLVEKVDEFADDTVGKMDYSTFNALLATYEAETKEQAFAKLDELRAKADQKVQIFIILLAFAAILLTIMVFLPKAGVAEMGVYTITAFVLLVAGIALPMIDIEATIASFSFLLIGEPVTFENQVLFFQSKSILEVVGILIQRGDAALAVVAILIFSFSILIPLLKLTFSFIALVRKKAPTSKVGQFIVFKSGKWSMADVMVVALFMAYIGFSGVINSQLTQLERASGTLEVFTTNNSTLQLGFYLFTAYSIVGLILSSNINRGIRNAQVEDAEIPIKWTEQ